MIARFRSHKIRKGRYSQPGGIYLLTVVSRNREPFFRDFSLGRLLVHGFRRAEMERLARSLAWVVMPDHFHWLVELQDAPLDELVRKTKCRATHAINQRLQRTGPLWQSSFHDRAIRREEDLQAVARYIVANPLRAGLVDRVGDYPLWDAIWL
ncbi:REP-associated tyrosine transposase [Pseudomonas asplenii]|uniref:REP-associated tyrosine transposase n=1 Tax=Pseudomonas asplenii TaxID=53407 RepID=UPI000372AE28|nr:transposase [Pseudomonas fuscovaginae]